MNTPVAHISVCGRGLVAHMTALALARRLGDSIRITLLDDRQSPGSDIFYGNIAPPTAYAFNLAIGVSEPRLLLHSSSTFAWGTQFARWGSLRRSWMQCFHLPLPIMDGVLFHQYLARLGVPELEPFLTSAVAARHGAFAHPLGNGPRLLARAEYGYQFDPWSYARPFAAAVKARRIQLIASPLARVECNGKGIVALHLANGQKHTADLYVDCSGSSASLISQLEPAFDGQRRLRAIMSRAAAANRSRPYRTVTGDEYGWQSEATLQGCTTRLTVFHPDAEERARAAHTQAVEHTGDITLGRRARAWSRNCVAIGHAAGAVEPLTHAPLLLVQRDVERLLSLIPPSTDMSTERREFNRQQAQDWLHAEMFNRALFETPPLAHCAYWRDARAQPPHERLAQKITQFESRGLLVAFDLEPFNAEDWTILHHGMGRRPVRHDRIADRASESAVRSFLANLQHEIENLAKSLPHHGDYVAGLIRYLKGNDRESAT